MSRCPMCHGEGPEAFTVTDRNRAMSDRRFPYRRCAVCATIYLADVPADLGRYYGETYHSLPTLQQLDTAAAGESFKLDILRRFVEPGPLVDVGAGFGVFARAAAGAGFEVTAIEMEPRCCSYLETTVGVPAINSDDSASVLRGLQPSRVIAMWHSLEHLPNPLEVLEAAAENLEPGGALIVAMPNPDSLQFRLLRGRWAHLDAPRHLFLAPAATLTERAGEFGLRCALMTTSDPAGRHWNRFGWEYALRRHPAVRPTTRAISIASLALTLALRPLEGRGINGATYTAVYLKGSA